MALELNFNYDLTVVFTVSQSLYVSHAPKHLAGLSAKGYLLT